MKLSGLPFLLLASPLLAADPAGLDLTIEVLGRDEQVDERIVNRIPIPGVTTDRAASQPRDAVTGVVDGVGATVNSLGSVVGGVVDGVVAPLLPVLRYEDWVEQGRDAGRERETR